MNGASPTAKPKIDLQYSLINKYELVSRFANEHGGTLLDLGARDRILRGYLDTSRIDYKSHDVIPDHDYTFDLENPIPLPDQCFDIVVALDVLEHVENIHNAFAEMMRIAGHYVIITLPVINNLNWRLSFLLTGQLGGKYWLMPEHQGDHHRWVTTYSSIRQFVGANALRCGFQIEQVNNELAYFSIRLVGKPLYFLARIAARLNWQADGLFTRSLTIFLRRET